MAKDGLLLVKQVEAHREKRFVLNFYRPSVQTLTLGQCLGTIFSLHNETINIWTHAVPGLYFVAVLFQHLSEPSCDIHYLLRILAISGCISVFMFSTIFHTLEHSSTHHDLALSLDMVGMLLGVGGINFNIIYYGFMPHPWIRNIYLGLFVCHFLGSFFLYSHPKGNEFFFDGKYAAFRTCYITAWAIIGFSALFHQILLEEDPRITAFYYQNVSRLLINGITAFVFYVSSIPERWSNGATDIYGTSHHIWHLAIALFTYLAYSFVFYLPAIRDQPLESLDDK